MIRIQAHDTHHLNQSNSHRQPFVVQSMVLPIGKGRCPNSANIVQEVVQWWGS
jgi:hypothetical protein